MRLNRARWLYRIARCGEDGMMLCGGVSELLRHLHERGWIEHAGPYTVRVTTSGICALEKAADEHARHLRGAGGSRYGICSHRDGSLRWTPRNEFLEALRNGAGT